MLTIIKLLILLVGTYNYRTNIFEVGEDIEKQN